jgi:hypothetical protein
MSRIPVRGLEMKNKIYTLLLTIFVFTFASPALAGYSNVEIIPEFDTSKLHVASCSDEQETCFLKVELPSIEGSAEPKDHMNIVMWFWKGGAIILFLHDKKYMSIYKDENDDYFYMDIDNSREMRETLSVYKPRAAQKIEKVDALSVKLPDGFLPQMEIRLSTN